MNEQDMEDHRLAALAAGISIKFKKELGCFIRLHNSCSKDSGFWGAWVPLASKSDSFDLMVACGMDIGFLDDALLVSASIFPCEDPYREVFVEMDEKINTVEKLYFEAIFRCAVEIGRAKEGKANAQN